jgi:hypothetical protein
MVTGLIIFGVLAFFLWLPLLGGIIAIKHAIAIDSDPALAQWMKDNPDANILRGHGGRGY